MVPPASHKVSRVSWYSGYCRSVVSSDTRLLRTMEGSIHILFSSIDSHLFSPQPRWTEVLRFGLFRFRSPLLTESRLISLPGPTEMFQFNPSSHVYLCIQHTLHGCLVHACFHIRKSPDQRIFAPPRGLSQLVTSFIGDWCQGIRPALLVT